MKQERCILVQVLRAGVDSWDAERELEELRGLADTAGALVVGNDCQRIDRPHAGTLIGRGKIEQIEEKCRHLSVDAVIFGEDLSPTWQRNLERELGRRVVDRTEVILDIFAQHARSNDGKVQVELAQLRYLRPRLTGRGTMLSRLGGGIGTRGPGETQLEVDRRRIAGRIDHLQKQVRQLARVRDLERKNRLRRDKTLLSIVGYTNAGKSTLLNALTGAEVLVQDQLFATLDPTTRKFQLPSGEEVLVSDTVGFIHHLPPALLHAFRATLEEVRDADLLLHVVDLSSPFLDREIADVQEVLRDLEASAKPAILVFNKADRVEAPDHVDFIQRRFPGSVILSALEGTGLASLEAAVLQEIRSGREKVTLEIPVTEGRTIASLRSSAEIVSEILEEDRLRFHVVLPPALLHRFEEYLAE